MRKEIKKLKAVNLIRDYKQGDHAEEFHCFAIEHKDNNEALKKRFGCDDAFFNDAEAAVYIQFLPPYETVDSKEIAIEDFSKNIRQLAINNRSDKKTLEKIFSCHESFSNDETICLIFLCISEDGMQSTGKPTSNDSYNSVSWSDMDM